MSKENINMKTIAQEIKKRNSNIEIPKNYCNANGSNITYAQFWRIT